MEASDGSGFDLPRFNVPSYSAYNQAENPGVARGHHRLSSLLSGEPNSSSAAVSPSSAEPSTLPQLQRSNSLSSAFYPSVVGATYRQQDPSPAQQLHPYQDYPNDYPPYNPARRQPATAKGALSPRSSLRHPPPTSPAISVTMDPPPNPSSYSTHQPPPPSSHAQLMYNTPDSYSDPSIGGYNQQHRVDDPSPSPSANFTPSYTNQQSMYPQNDPYGQYPQQDLSRASSSMQHTSTHSSSIRNSVSTPNTPLSARTYQTPNPAEHRTYASQQYMIDPQPPPPQHRHKLDGLRRVRDSRDLKPLVNPQPSGRRADPNGSGFLSPARCLTTHISSTYNICNPQFRYEMAHNPRRVLTKPSKAAHNEGYDNEDYDYILYVNDWLGTDEGHNKYLILDVLGQGTFGQVVKCQNMKTHEIVAVKVVKNKPAYFNQSMMEVQILQMLNDRCDPRDEHHILRLRETFIHKNHLCLVFELLSSNLYELIKQNQFGGLSTQLVKVFTAQLLDALTVLKESQLIHCDLKPENILLKSLQAPTIKVIDFGSACHESQTVYTYIQSRFYRSPEVLLGLGYSSAIDMWSLGCIAVELFLGLPLFPGTSEYNQITRIVEMLGMPPAWMLSKGKQAGDFFSAYLDEYGQKQYRLKSIEQYSREHGKNEQPGKKYFTHNTLPEIIKNAPIQKSSSRSGTDVEKEMQHRTSFIDFVSGLLNLNPLERWTPQQARLHPFITGEKFVKPFQQVLNERALQNTDVPAPAHPPRSSSLQDSGQGSDGKRYGGLVPQPPKGTRPYTDAGEYGQRLAQHQAHIAQQQAQAATTNTLKNPYITGGSVQQTTGTNGQSGYVYSPTTSGSGNQPPPPTQYASRPKEHLTLDPYANPPTQTQQQTRMQPLNSMVSPYNTSMSANIPTHQQPHPPSSSYYPNNRGRANTINQLDQVPPSLARAHLDLEAAGMGRNTLTPVINREDPVREWERRQAAGRAGAGPAFPQLEYLQQQVEMDASGGANRWAAMNTGQQRYAPTQPSSLQFQSPPAAVVVDTQDRGGNLRDAALSSARVAAGLSGTTSTGRYDHARNSANVPAPPQPAYSTASPMAARYNNGPSSGSNSAYQPPSQAPGQSQPTYDAFDQRDGIGTLYMPMQPNSYSNYTNSSAPPQNPSTPQGATSLYGSGVVPSGGPPPATAYMTPASGAQQQQAAFAKDGRRLSGMDVGWSR